jgi:formylmethanofuran dehydrogenase subunit B
LYCDDLSVAVASGRVSVTANGCPIANHSFAHASAPASSRIKGRDAALDAACDKAAEILGNARMPLVGGLASDLAGIKAAMSLAERLGGVIDHAGSEAAFRNMLALQDKGWMTTTYAEVKNRADLILIAGTDIVSRFPRFFERFVWTKESLFGAPPARDIVYLGKGLNTKAGVAPDRRKPAVIACDVARIGEVFQALRAILRGTALSADSIAGASNESLIALAEKIRAAKYGLVVWSAGEMEGPAGELAVESICRLVAEINETSRFSGLPLGGNDNGLGAGQVGTWTAGFPLRTSFASGRAEYDPHLYSWRRMIESGEADAVLWISAFRPLDLPFQTKVPLIVVGAPGADYAREPDVFLAVGTPGLDHAGHVIRGDAVASLPLHKLRDSGLPRTAEVLQKIESRVSKLRKS